MEKEIVWPPALMCNNSRTTYYEAWRGCFTSVFQQVVIGFDTDNTLLLMKCSKQDMLESMMLLLVGVSLVLMKCNKEDMLEGMLLLLVGVIVLHLKSNKDVMLEGEVVAPVSTMTTHRKA